MQLLSQIPFAILNNIGFVAILYILYQIIKYYFTISAATLYTLVSCMQLFSLLHFFFYLQYPELISYASLNDVIKNNLVITDITSGINILQLLGILYFLGVLYFVLNIFIQLINVDQLKRKADYSNSSYYNQLVNIDTRVFVKIKIGLSDDIDSPITFGWINPIILLPISISTQLSVKELESILLHELAHILRNDYVFNLIISIVGICLFFNPFVLLLNNEMSLQREIACDNRVILFKVNKLDYTNALLKLAMQSRQQNILRVSLGILNSKNQLIQRIKHINLINIKSNKLLLTQLCIGAFGSVLLLLPLHHWSKAQVQAKKSTIITARSIVKLNNNKGHTHTNVITDAKSNRKKVTHIYSINNSNRLDKKSFNSIPSSLKLKNNFSDDSYAVLVKKAMHWIKQREPITEFASYNEEKQQYKNSITEQLLIQSIVRNYQLKRAVLYSALSRSLNEPNEKEVFDYVMNSPEWEEMLQFEKWTKEILKNNQLGLDTTHSNNDF